MNCVEHPLVVGSLKPPIVEFDPEAGAIYIRFGKRKIAETVEKECSHMVLTVDLDRSGGVVGVEAIGFTEFTLAKLLKAANIRSEGIDFARARFRGSSRLVEKEPIPA
jgi:uncharacterized protein YuzE